MLSKIIKREGAYKNYTISQQISAIEAYITEQVVDAGGLSAADLDTFAELQSLVADATLLRNSAIDTIAELNALLSDGNVALEGADISIFNNNAAYITSAALNTIAKLNTIVADATILVSGADITALNNNAGYIAALLSDTTPSLGGNLDLNSNGITIEEDVSGTVSAGDVITMNTGLTDELYVQADASTLALAEGVLGIAVDSGLGNGSPTTIQIGGILSGAFTANKVYYLSETAGEYTTTAPSGGAYVRKVGFAITTTKMILFPFSSLIETVA